MVVQYSGEKHIIDNFDSSRQHDASLTKVFNHIAVRRSP